MRTCAQRPRLGQELEAVHHLGLDLLWLPCTTPNGIAGCFCCLLCVMQQHSDTLPVC